MTDRFDDWMASLEARHLADLRFAEVTRALRALSATYVQHRQRLSDGAVFSGAGKRAAFALFYGPLHFLLIREIVRRLSEPAAQAPSPARSGTLVDLGCGTGVAGAAWADARGDHPKILAVDRHPWALQEAARTYRAFGLSARTALADAAAKLPAGPTAVVAAFTLNELPEHAREALLRMLVDRTRDAGSFLVVEPLAGFVAPWWKKWAAIVEEAGGRADEWRVRLELPPIVAKLDRAAGLDHRELTGRSLAMGYGCAMGPAR